MLTLLFASAAIQAATPAPSADTPDTKTVREVVIINDGDSKSEAKPKGEVKERMVLITRRGKGETPEGATRTIRLHQMGGDHGDHMMMLADCGDGTKVESQGSGEKDGKKIETKVLVCAKGGNQLEALEKAQKRIADNKDIPEEVRSKVLASLDAQIAQLKAAKR